MDGWGRVEHKEVLSINFTRYGDQKYRTNFLHILQLATLK